LNQIATASTKKEKRVSKKKISIKEEKKSGAQTKDDQQELAWRGIHRRGTGGFAGT